MKQTRFVAGPDRGVVTFDGEEIQDVVECDTLHGFVIQLVRGTDGKLKQNDDGEVCRRMFIGEVTFMPLVSL